MRAPRRPCGGRGDVTRVGNGCLGREHLGNRKWMHEFVVNSTCLKEFWTMVDGEGRGRGRLGRHLGLLFGELGTYVNKKVTYVDEYLSRRIATLV
jgi:hypothetical protein